MTAALEMELLDAGFLDGVSILVRPAGISEFASNSGDGFSTTTEEEMLGLSVLRLLDRYPETAPVMAANGIDGLYVGPHTVLKALILNGAELDSVIPELMRFVQAADDTI